MNYYLKGNAAELDYLRSTQLRVLRLNTEKSVEKCYYEAKKEPFCVCACGCFPAEREGRRAARVEAEALQQAGLLQPVSQHADRTREAGTVLLV